MKLVGHHIEVEKEADGRILSVSVSGVLRKEDYELFVPDVDEAIERLGSVRMLVDLVGFRGWTLGALYEDTKFAVKHYRGLERVAIVGDRKWEKAMATLCKPFTKAEVRYFDIARRDAARTWLWEGVESSAEG